MSTGETAANPQTPDWNCISAFVGVTTLDIFKTSGQFQAWYCVRTSPAVFVSIITGKWYVSLYLWSVWAGVTQPHGPVNHNDELKGTEGCRELQVDRAVLVCRGIDSTKYSLTLFLCHKMLCHKCSFMERGLILLFTSETKGCFVEYCSLWSR